jgi:endonuclease I
MRVLLFFLVISLQLSNSFSQNNSYYSSISIADSGLILKQKLTTILQSTHTNFLSYTPGVWNVLDNSDQDSENSLKVVLLYGSNDNDASTINDRTRLKSMKLTGSGNAGYWNREHTFPKSLGTPDLGTSGAGSDAHHLRPCDVQMNSARGNRIFVNGNGSAQAIGSTGFFPGEEWKGDVARMIMYMYLRYPNQCNAASVGNPTQTISQIDQIPDIFILWHEQDSVSSLEIQRNQKVFEAQGNRNPFIDNPDFATRIWRKAENNSSNVSVSSLVENAFQVYPNPTQENLSITFPETLEWNFTISDGLGREVLSGEQTNLIHLETISPGNYFLNIHSKDQTWVKKISKVN